MLKLLVATILIVVTAAGCSSPSDDWRLSQEQPRAHAQWVVERTFVRFHDRSIDPVDGDLTLLLTFLERHRVTESDRLHVEGAGQQDTAGFAGARATLVVDHLRQAGYRPRLITGVRRSDKAPLGVDLVRVTIGRFVASVPNCPDWRYPSAAGPKNLRSSNFGCANAVNFAAMLDNPRDLIFGRGGGSTLRGEAAVVGAHPLVDAVESYAGRGAPQPLTPAISAPPTAPPAEGEGSGLNIPSITGSGTMP